ncbi:signal peptidase I [Candidatus Parcubacteria bacterium]|nr:MAG: signal peptidase I [Candidatus Parcubacteria bacterium]
MSEISEKNEPWVYKVFGSTIGSIIMFFLEVAQIIVIALAIIIPVRYFLVQPFVVKGVSMEPNFYENDYLIVDEITYRFRDVQRGEAVVLRPPTGVNDYYIKRIIGLPGETVEIKNGQIKIYNSDYPNGFVLDEDYINEITTDHMRVVLNSDQYFVMGDNRDQSLDSRSFGPITKDEIVGRVWLRGFPINRIGVISAPDYSF